MRAVDKSGEIDDRWRNNDRYRQHVSLTFMQTSCAIGTFSRLSARLCLYLRGNWRHHIFEFPRVEGERNGTLSFLATNQMVQKGRSPRASVTSLVKLTFIMAPNLPSVKLLERSCSSGRWGEGFTLDFLRSVLCTHVLQKRVIHDP